MVPRHLGRVLGDRRGVALPMALFTLLLLTALSVAFVTMSQTEPLIASNHLRVSQARALAESGLEQVLWAIVNSTATGSLSNMASVSLNTVAQYPYDGSTFVRVRSAGGFTVTVTVTAKTGTVTDQISVVTLGQTTSSDPSSSWSSASGVTATAKSRVQASYVRFPDVGIGAPCALCVSGNVSMTGSTDLAGNTGGTCGDKFGLWTTGTFSQSGNNQINGNRPAIENTDYKQNQSQDTFNEFALTDAAISALRTLAKSQNRHYKPTSAGGTYTFNSMPSSGLIFIDTFGECNAIQSSGNCSATTASLGPNSFSGGGAFNGWLIVIGNVATNGNFGGVNGFIYMDGDVGTGGMGNSGITGIMMVRRRLGTTDSSTAGNANVTFNCDAVRNNQPITAGWSLVKGTYCDNPNGC